MLLFAILLAISVGIAGFAPFGGNGHANLGHPVRCSIRFLSSTGRFLAVGLDIYLLIAYWAALTYVFPNGETNIMMWLNIHPAMWLERALGPMGLGYQFQERFMHYKPFPAIKMSFLLQLVWWAISLATSLAVRIIGRGLTKTAETSWTFGQALACAMLALPILNAVEVYFGE